MVTYEIVFRHDNIDIEEVREIIEDKLGVEIIEINQKGVKG